MTRAAASRCPMPSSRRAVSRRLHGSSSTLPPPDTPMPMTATPADTEILHGAVAFIVGRRQDDNAAHSARRLRADDERHCAM